jgi:gliding motility-associated-like protein
MISEVSCHGECDGVARVSVNGGVVPYSVKWSTGQTDQVAVSGGFSQAVNLCGGDYKVTVVDKLGADYVFDVPVPEPAEIVVTLASVPSATFNSCDAEFIAEAPGAVGPITYNWSGSYGHSGESQRAEGLCAGEIVEFIIYDANGCASVGRDTVAYPEDGCYQVRPVISPGNQDGNNDFVFITCIEAVSNSIEIYNRWGQLVYETNGYDNAGNVWKGLTKNGQPLAEGVYFYVLNYTDPVRGQQQQKGHINLLR